MARPRDREESQSPSAISIVGPAMRVIGDCVTEGTIRVEGHVRGSIWAGKAVVVGTEGGVHGEIRTQDAVIAGQVAGCLIVASRLEVQGSARIEGEVHARRLQLEEGAVLNGDIRMGDVDVGPPPPSASLSAGGEGEEGGPGLPEEGDSALR